MDSDSDSDSDSDGSHVSATPPRKPAPPRRPPRPPKTAASLPSFKSKPLKPPPEPPIEAPPPRPSPPSSSLPFQIRFASSLDAPALETLPAGYFSRSAASFSKLRRPDLALNLEEEEKGNVGLWAAGSGESVKKKAKAKQLLPNLIGGAGDPPPVVMSFCKPGRAEGNFVKLNLNGGGKRKFGTRYGGKTKSKSSYLSNGRRFYRRKSVTKGSQKRGDAGEEDEIAEILSEVKGKGSGNDGDFLVEEAVSAARSEASDDNLLRLLNVVYGHDSFRDGQLEVVKMVLQGKSTMLVLPTGTGKTLCYQIPALILPGITLVVSPLVALMIDQLKQLPPAIPGVLLCSSQTPQEIAETLSMVRDGRVKVLFISPERLMNPQFVSALAASPLISLLVVDEAHCVSEWSHNFRPSYMRLKASVLRASLKVQCILAMTATATMKALDSVMSALEIPSTNLLRKANLRENLQLSISLSGNRMKDLLLLMKSAPFSEVKSIIVYCKFQYETDLVSRYLCDNNISAKSYHSAITSKERSRIQQLFCSNKIKVVVATVAFGMGLDKKDVGAVFHYTLPESLEEYVQEIGRAGRDGNLSYCHLFFDDVTYFKLRSLMYSDGIDEYSVNKFLSQVFCDGSNSHGNICSIIIESASRKFDMKEEVMITVLTQLELGEVQYLRLLPQLNATCTLSFYKTSPEVLAEKDILASAILKRSEIKQGSHNFDIPALANSIGVTTSDLLDHLQALKLKGEITYELKDPAYCYTIIKVPQDICSLTVQLTRWLNEVERTKIHKLDTIYDAALHAVNKCDKTKGCFKAQHTPCLQRKILDYFNEADTCEIPNRMNHSSPFLRADIKVLLQSNSHAKFTPRAIARIMHGIASPAYPKTVWSKSHFWGRYINTDFQLIMEAAKAELVKCVRGEDAG